MRNDIELGTPSLASPETGTSPRAINRIRNHNAVMLNKLPVVCHTLRTVARGDTRYSAVMFYERTRLGAADSGHFLEALAPGLSLFSGNTALVLQDDDVKKLNLRTWSTIESRRCKAWRPATARIGCRVSFKSSHWTTYL